MPAKRSSKTVKSSNTEQMPVDLGSSQSVSNLDHISSDMLHHNKPDAGQSSEPDVKSMDNKDLVVFSLRQILTDMGASAAAKASAARTLAEIEGVLGRHANPPKDPAKSLASMSREELEAELAKESAGIA